MRERENNQQRKEPKTQRHPIRQQLVAVALGLCLIVVSIPLLPFSLSVQAAEQQEFSENIGLSREENGQAVSTRGRNLEAGLVTLDDGETDRKNGKQDSGNRKKDSQKVKTQYVETEALFGEEELPAVLTEPGCGIISEDVTWTAAGILENGELVVMPGVTLTISENLTVRGNVVIKGGGTIARGGIRGGFTMGGGTNLTVGDVTLDGCSSLFPQATVSMITANGINTITLESGCTIRNCSSTSNGAAICFPGSSVGNSDITINGAVIENCLTKGIGGAICAFDKTPLKSGTITLNNATIRNCTAGTTGGGIYAPDIDVTINGGHYENNKTTQIATSFVGGGFIFICRATLIINDGIFTGNSCVNKGGCISHCGHPNTRTYIYGGTFSGNTCSSAQYAGSGALYNSTVEVGDTSVTVSGDVKFVGNTDDSGTDGIYLDARDQTLRKIQISDTLTYPVKVFLRPTEGYVIAQGVNDYQLLRKRDMKKITFVDATNSGKKWYAVLDEEANQVYMSETDPGYAYFVYYIKNGAKGTAPTDDAEYDLEDPVTVKSAEGLSYEGRFFAGWNTEEDGSGTMYQEGDSFALEGDTNLYAIFREGIAADFYSGSAGNKQTIVADMDWETDTGTVMTPEPQPMDGGFTAVGWSESHQSYDRDLMAGVSLTLTGNATYYGVYEKEVTLSYDANGGETCPESETGTCRANVGEEIGYDIPSFTVAGEATKTGAIFRGWNTQADGNGTMYQQGDVLELEQDEELYAIFEDKPALYADFYSGSAGNKEREVTLLEEGAVSGSVTAPLLKPMMGFEKVGWDESHDEFTGEIVEGTALTLTENTSYYGVYRKEVTLSYDANGGETCPGSETGTCYANVGEDLSYSLSTFTAAAPQPREGYVFAGWNTRSDGKGEPCLAGESLELDHDTVLYAVWAPGDCTPYRVEHYRQDLEGDSYTRVDADTEYIAGRTGDTVEAEANPYAGFSRSQDPELGRAEGTVEADGSLVLQVYYDRDLYEVGFDLNGGEGAAPQTQTVRYGGCLQEVPEPQRRGYTFKGWYTDREGTEPAYWDFWRTVEENSKSLKATLYAKWADETAPALGEAEFGESSGSFMDWAIGQKKLTITVPVTEEGSGLRQGDYSLRPETGKPRSGTAAIRVQQFVTPELRARSGGLSAVLTVRGNARTGQSVAVITIAEEFRGSVTLTCTDNAGNISAEKVLTADGAGAIVEDNAPGIRFSKAGENKAKSSATVDVDVEDSAVGSVTAGLKSVTYRLDGGKERAVGKGEFADSMVESYHFAVDIRGEGKHTLEVTAADNAGNSTTRKTAVEISRRRAAVTPNPQGPAKTTKPAAGEPATGESTFVKVFATLGMVAGFTYLLLYFTGGESGITEGEKEEVIARLVRWARKGRFRKYPALVIILLFLLYYHSIGRSVGDEWKKVYEG